MLRLPRAPGGVLARALLRQVADGVAVHEQRGACAVRDSRLLWLSMLDLFIFYCLNRCYWSHLLHDIASTNERAFLPIRAQPSDRRTDAAVGGERRQRAADGDRVAEFVREQQHDGDIGRRAFVAAPTAQSDRPSADVDGTRDSATCNLSA